MRKWNKEAAPNNNMTSADIEFSEELADGGERNERYEGQKNKEH